jgi:cell division protein FtsI/penicillin-binding protein 2
MQKGRVGLVIFFFVFFFIILLIRLITVAFFPDSRLKTMSSIEPKRGSIYDVNGKELALYSPSFSLYARPDQLSPQMRDYLYKILIQLNFLSKDDLKALYKEKGFVWLKRKITPSEKQVMDKLIAELKNKKAIKEDELGVVEEQGRFYPYWYTGSMLGFVGIDNQGLGGIEYHFNSYLDKGNSVYTSIDPFVCAIIYDEIKNGVLQFEAEMGSVVVMNVETREVIAMANFPTYDPNDFSTIKSNTIRPAAVSEIYEPGSVMKIFTAANALNQKTASPQSPTYYCGKEYQVGDYFFTSPAIYGNVDLTGILQKSINVGMVQVAAHFQKKQYYDYLRSLGFGSMPLIPLTGMESGILRPVNLWSYLSKYMLAIGQEIGVTTLQLAAAACVIAGGGVYKNPVIVRSVKDPSGIDLYMPKTIEIPVLSQDVCAKTLTMLKTVVSEQGTAIKAQVEGIAIAGKTGTGQVAKKGGAGYYTDLYNAVFIGFVPADNPKLVIVVTVNRPHAPEHTGGAVAAPVFANIVRRIIISTSYL